MKISDSQIVHAVVALLVGTILGAAGNLIGPGVVIVDEVQPFHPSFLAQERVLAPLIVLTSVHILMKMPLIARISIVLLRLVIVQMLLVYSRGTAWPTILMLIPLGVETGLLLTSVAVVFVWLAGIPVVYLFGSNDSAWNQVVPTLSGISLGVIVVSFGAVTLLGSALRGALARVDRAQQTAGRLQENVLNLTQANLKFMQYAATAEARSKEEERTRITRDIHDSIGYALTNILAMARLVVRLSSEHSRQVTEIAHEIEGQAHEGLLQMRGAVRKLRATRDEGPSGQAAIIRLIQTFSMATGIHVTADFANSSWPENASVSEVLFHIVQESLTNSFRHGQATEISVVFSRVDRGVRVVVEDNGEGASVVEFGVGLAGMAERADAVGGYTRPEPLGNGFRVVGWVPL